MARNIELCVLKNDNIVFSAKGRLHREREDGNLVTTWDTTSLIGNDFIEGYELNDFKRAHSYLTSLTFSKNEESNGDNYKLTSSLE